jgi:hypothetical protein
MGNLTGVPSGFRPQEAAPPAPLTPVDHRQFDYSELDHSLAQTDQAIRHARRTLAQPARVDAGSPNEPLDACVPVRSLTSDRDRR